MAKAHQAPSTPTSRYRYISSHAIERLRERIIALNLNHRLDDDLIPWLDEIIEGNIVGGNVRAVLDNQETTRIVDISSNLGAPGFAVVKANDRKNSPYPEAVVTILDEVMVSQYEERKRWRPAGAMAQQLAKLPAGAVVTPQSFPKATVTQPPIVETKKSPKPAIADDAQVLVSYVDREGIQYMPVKAADLRSVLSDLANDADVENETLRVWREVPTTVRVKIDIDIDL